MNALQGCGTSRSTLHRAAGSLARRSVFVLIAGAAAVSLVPTLSFAQAWPTKPVKILVPFPAGGATDQLARKVGEKLAVSLGQPFVIENRPGASGLVAGKAVAGAPADGYTLLVAATGPIVVAPVFNPQQNFAPLRDLEPVTNFANSPLVIAAHPGRPFKSIAEMVQKAKAAPGTISYGTSGNGSSMHLTGELLAYTTKTRLIHVPYKGNAPSVQDALAGQIDMVFSDIPVVLPYFTSGQLLPLAVTSAKRHPLLPNVPTLEEAGFPGLETMVWNGMFAPAGTPKVILDKLQQAVVEAMKTPDFVELLASKGVVAVANTPREFRSQLEVEIPKWEKAIADTGVKP